MSSRQAQWPALKSCPFCGEAAVGRREWQAVVATHYVECTRCEAQGGADEGPEEAARHWNKRIGDSEPDSDPDADADLTPCDWCRRRLPDEQLQNETQAGDAICDRCADEYDRDMERRNTFGGCA